MKNCGRPPIGDRAMTNAERQQRHRDKKKAAKAPPIYYTADDGSGGDGKARITFTPERTRQLDGTRGENEGRTAAAYRALRNSIIHDALDKANFEKENLDRAGGEEEMDKIVRFLADQHSPLDLHKIAAGTGLLTLQVENLLKRLCLIGAVEMTGTGESDNPKSYSITDQALQSLADLQREPPPKP